MDDSILEEIEEEGELKKDIIELMRDHDLEKDEAERVKEIMDDHDLDADIAVELKDVL